MAMMRGLAAESYDREYSDRQLVRPLMLVLPKDHPSDFSEGR